MLDYREIIRDRYDLHMSGREIARALGISKSGVNSFLKAFEASANIHYPLPEAVTNAEIQKRVYGPLEERMLAYSSRFASPDFGKDESTSLAEQWRSYRSRCLVSGRQFYSYRQYCAKYAAWKKEQDKVISPVSRTAPTIEIGLMDQTFELVNRRTGEITEITVAAAVLSGCGLIYAEGLCSDEGSVWIDFLNRMIRNFGGISSVICIQDSRQAEHTGKKRKTAWEKDAELSEWAKHKHTEMRPLLEPEEDFAKAQRALEEMVFPDLERETFFSLSDFNAALSESLERRNNRKFSNRNYSPHDLWIKKKGMLQILPDELYLYTERKNVKVSGDYHIKFDEAYYSVPFRQVYNTVRVEATRNTVTVRTLSGSTLCIWPRAQYRGQWQTNPEHLPSGNSDPGGWNGNYFRRKAAAIGPYTEKAIEQVLHSKQYEAQTYRYCIWILGFAKSFSSRDLEIACRKAILNESITYRYIKNALLHAKEN